MSTETTTHVAKGTSKAAEKAIAAVAAASETLPTVVEHTEVAFDIPSKVVLNQKLVVAAGVVTGIALGAGALYGWQRFQNYRAVKKIERQANETSDQKA